MFFTVRRLIVTGVIAVALAGGGIAIYAVQATWFSLPDPRTADREGLFRWLVLRDLEQEPLETQHLLVDRLQEELLRGIDGGEDAGQLSEGYREQLVRNVEHLKRVWFNLRADQYAELPDEKKTPFLERQIEVVACWSQLDLGGAGESNAAATGFFDQLEIWIIEADGERKARMIAGVTDGVVCWLARYDLAEQTAELRADLARRIARELDYGLRLDGVGEGMTPAQRTMLIANGELLVEAWLHEQAIAHETLDANEQAAFVDGLIDRFMGWQIGDALVENSGEVQGQTAVLMRLSTLAETFIDRADDDARPRLRGLISHVKRRLLWRQLNKLVPPLP